jgi:hypothetical protein
MRARNIKPGFFKNEDLVNLKPIARLLFIGLWCLADCEGRLEDRPKRIQGELFPYERVNVEPLLADLDEHGFILRYEVLGNKYIQVKKFKLHQNPHPNEKPSKLPAPGDITSAHVKEVSAPADSLNTESLNKSTTYSREVASIFTYWQTVMGKPKAILTADRRAKIQARLRDGYTEEQIKQGIDGCRASAWHMGENPNGKQYNDFDLICRNGSKLEQFIAAKEGSKTALQILRERWNK